MFSPKLSRCCLITFVLSQQNQAKTLTIFLPAVSNPGKRRRDYPKDTGAKVQSRLSWKLALTQEAYRSEQLPDRVHANKCTLAKQKQACMRTL